ncbi:bifunctional folylpolyglutamate synthase/dihydrofolate synthase [Flavobacteriaceae bacterium F08102]|nr:bifunctional folylpolyglutamate synthase/dihydrofolate synthase [Flavobacteriaceae bacterium F08102]
MNYQETLDWMFSKLPMYQRQGSSAFKKDLTNTLALAERLHNPHQKFKSVHVAGTNGKGSTSHMIASVLQEAGYSVGLYTSPHLKDFRERIRINGIPIPAEEVVGFVHNNQAFLEERQLSFFEMTVGLAFDFFAKQEVDIAVIEVGLGGRLDSTNIIQPLVSVITNIGYDHMQMLGETLVEIAVEKAGIIKKHTPVIISEQQVEVWPVFQATAKRNAAPIYLAEDLVEQSFKTDLGGWYQQKNSKAAVQTLEILRSFGYAVSDSDVEKGLLKVVENTGLLGRYQMLQEHPKVICDTAHNAEGLRLVLEQLLQEPFEQLHMVVGFVNDKNIAEILKLFPRKAQYYFCSPAIPRGLPVEMLAEEAMSLGFVGTVYASVNEAFRSALNAANSKDLIYVGGSTFVVAEIV